MTPLSIPRGSQVLLGRAAKPMPESQSAAISKLVRSVQGVREAYLPQCFIQGVMEGPAQVLVLVVDPGANKQGVLDAVGEGLTRTLPSGVHLDVWPLDESNDLLSSVRETRTHIHCTPPVEKKPWCKIFA